MNTITRSRALCPMGVMLLAAPLLLAGAAGCAPSAPPLGSATGAVTTAIVAAVQYGSGQAAKVKAACASEPEPDVCAVQELVQQAVAAGAILVVVPELALGQQFYEPEPKIGDQPATDSTWKATSFIKIFSQRAAALKIHLVIHVQTAVAKTYYSTQIAYSPEGTIVGTHHKFELFDSERTTLTPGADVMVFDSPLGKVGLLICADMYGSLALHHKLSQTLQARVVALSSYWTAPGGSNFQQSYARNWGVYVIGSNTTTGAGVGGGIFDPDGKALVRKDVATPWVATFAIPAP